MTQPPSLTSSQILAVATEVLLEGAYDPAEAPPSWTGTSRLFEDPYGIVAVHVYETWNQLIEEWHIAQGLLVDLISAHLTRPEPKSWEGYLVLLTPTPVVGPDRSRVTEVRYDTNRVRKLIATGDELETLEDVRSVLLPLLPLTVETASATRARILERLPGLLKERGIEPGITETLVNAFLENNSLMERLHQSRGLT